MMKPTLQMAGEAGDAEIAEDPEREGSPPQPSSS
jgi:hypothetical protein